MKLSVKNLAIVMGVVLILPVFAWAMPSMPHQFYGTVAFSNGPSPDGLLVEAKVNGVNIQSTVTKNGKYGYDPVFKVEDNSSTLSGKTIKFYAAGIDTGATAVFKNGESTNLPLAVQGVVGTITKSADEIISNQSITITSTAPTVVKMGSSAQITVSSQSNTTATIEKVEKLTSSFFTGATAVIAGNNLLNAYEIKINGSGLNITAAMNYDDTGIDESTIKPYRFSGSSWVEVAGFSINTTANTVTFSLPAAATPYSLFGRLAVTVSSGVSSGGGGGGGGIFIPSVPASTLSAAAQKVDANKDGKIDILDFNTLMVHWGEVGANTGDFNSDGKIDIFDFNLLMVNWTG